MDEVDARYQDRKTLAKIKKELSGDLPIVALGDFLTPEGLASLEKDLRKGWKASTIPDRHSYSIRDRLPLCDTLAAFCKSITKKLPLDEGVRRFAHKDFTLLHDEVAQPTGVLCFLCMGEWDETYGGELVFTKKGETLARFTPRHNTLLIVQRKRGVQCFVKYVNHKAGERSFVLVSG